MDPAAIQEQIDRILRSRSFAGKSQLRKLLEVLYMHIESQTTLKTDLVVQELWPEETRTKRSTDVATEMNRLRKALESYYCEEGKSDPITISLPNRASPAADAHQAKRWIVAMPREAGGDNAAVRQAQLRSVISSRPFKILALVAALSLLALLSIRILAGQHDEPSSGRISGEIFTAVNAEGKELWSKSFSGGFQPEYYEHGVARRMWFGDLEGNGHSDVLLLYQPAVDPRSHSTTLICYSDRGKEKWRWNPGRVLPELEGNPATYVTDAFAVMNSTGKQPARIVVSSFHDPLYPDQIAIVGSNGKTLSEYWHSGHLEHLALADLDGDGKQEIVATGISNGYREATLVVLDPDRVFGASAEVARPEIQIHGMGRAEERLRLLFPRSDLNRTLSVYNVGEEPTIEAGRIRFSTRECEKYPGCVIWYEFDKNFDLLSVLADDGFRSAHAEFYVNSKNAHSFNSEEEAEFRKVRCLVGCKTEIVTSEIR